MRTSTINHISREVARSRDKYPGNARMLDALKGEVEDLAQALLQGDEEFYEEAMHVACIAIRIMEEGDADFPYTEQCLLRAKQFLADLNNTAPAQTEVEEC